MLKVGDRHGRCERCRSRTARLVVAKIVERRPQLIRYVARCPRCGHEHRGELDYGLLADVFSVPKKGGSSHGHPR